MLPEAGLWSEAGGVGLLTLCAGSVKVADTGLAWRDLSTSPGRSGGPGAAGFAFGDQCPEHEVVAAKLDGVMAVAEHPLHPGCLLDHDSLVAVNIIYIGKPVAFVPPNPRKTADFQMHVEQLQLHGEMNMFKEQFFFADDEIILDAFNRTFQKLSFQCLRIRLDSMHLYPFDRAFGDIIERILSRLRSAVRARYSSMQWVIWTFTPSSLCSRYSTRACQLCKANK